jgi:hypothetical protein
VRTFFYRPYPLSLEKPLIDCEVFDSWIDLWMALTQHSGELLVVVPENFKLPRGYWNIPRTVYVIICTPDDVHTKELVTNFKAASYTETIQ